VTTPDPPNPYVAPSTPLADGAVGMEPPRGRKPSRLAAVVVALLAYPGAGLWVLGLRRRFVGWTAAVLLALALLIAGVWVPVPKLTIAATILLAGAALSALVATLISKPGRPRARYVLPIAVGLIIASHGGARAIRYWLVEAFQMPSASMMPALLVGDHMYVKKGSGGIARGDVIAFKFPQDTRTDYVKRVVAIGGDTINVTGTVVSVNGIPLDHVELADECPPLDEPGACKLVRETNAGRSYTIMLTGYPASDHPSTVVPEGHVFVMGDNRDNSYDSRKWGTVDVELITGKAKITWWSKAPGGPVRWSRVGRAIE
jgi:signal peptidase I